MKFMTSRETKELSKRTLLSAVSRQVRVCLAKPGYNSGLLPPIYYRPNKCFTLNSISDVLSFEHIFSVLFFYLIKIFKYYFYFNKTFSQYFDKYLSKH